MSEAISMIGLDAAKAAGSPQAVDPKASLSDQRAFEAAFQRHAGAGQEVSSINGANASQAPQAASEPQNGLRSLLANFDRLDGGVAKIRQSAEGLLAAGEEFTPSQVVQLTMQCQQFMFQTQLTSNVANRTSDGIQQLFRQQS